MKKNRQKSKVDRKLLHHYEVAEGAKVRLGKWATEEKKRFKDKDDFNAQMDKIHEELERREEVLYAEKRYGVLIILQGMDTSGKDGTIKHIMSSLNPQGVEIRQFGAPSREELQHDFLWRTHKELPPRGKIGIFNRSYYEECLTVRVHEELLDAQNLPKENVKSKDFWHDRLSDIRHHEAYLTRQGYRIVKFFLHISKDEQRNRLLKRLEVKEKNWKFDPSDVSERRYWNQLQRAYEHVLQETSTKQAPWYVIPANDKAEARLTISHILLQHLCDLPLAYPEVSPEKRKVLLKAERSLRDGEI